MCALGGPLGGETAGEEGIQEPGVHGKGSHVCMFQERQERYWGIHRHMCGYIRDGEFPRVLNFGEGVQPVAED